MLHHNSNKTIILCIIRKSSRQRGIQNTEFLNSLLVYIKWYFCDKKNQRQKLHLCFLLVSSYVIFFNYARPTSQELRRWDFTTAEALQEETVQRQVVEHEIQDLQPWGESFSEGIFFITFLNRNTCICHKFSSSISDCLSTSRFLRLCFIIAINEQTPMKN